MRKVKFKKWIPATYTPMGSNCIQVRTEGTGCWEDDFIHKGIFHQWANTYEEFESGAGNYTVALVEIESGEIVEVLPSKITFIEL